MPDIMNSAGDETPMPGIGVGYTPPEDLKKTYDILESYSKENVPDKFTDENGNQFILNGTGFKTYSRVPTMKGQSQKPGMYKTGAIEVKVFNLSKETDLQEYNKLLSDAGPQGKSMDGDPSVLINGINEQFYQGVFYVRVAYQPIWYLLPIKKP